MPNPPPKSHTSLLPRFASDVINKLVLIYLAGGTKK